MYASIGGVVSPLSGLGIEVEQIAESAPGPEAAADEADRSLDATFSLAFFTLQARTAKQRARAYSRNFGLKIVAVAVCESAATRRRRSAEFFSATSAMGCVLRLPFVKWGPFLVLLAPSS